MTKSADFGHQAGLFRDRNELAGRDHATRLVVPAHQRLDAGDGSAGERHLRLEVDLERLLRDGDAQIVFELLAVLEFAPQFLREE